MGRPIVCGISVRKDLPSSELTKHFIFIGSYLFKFSIYHVVIMDNFMSDFKEVEMLEDMGSSQLANSEMSKVNLLINLIKFMIKTCCGHTIKLFHSCFVG